MQARTLARWLRPATLRIGFLAQPQLELLETPDGEHMSTNLFVRRIRVLFGGKVAGIPTSDERTRIGRRTRRGRRQLQIFSY